MTRGVFVHEARIRLDAAEDTDAVGGAVTTALCGSWDHDGRCRWPHNNAVAGTTDGVSFRTLFVAESLEEAAVRGLIEDALSHGSWTLVSAGSRPPTPDEAVQGERLARS